MENVSVCVCVSFERFAQINKPPPVFHNASLLVENRLTGQVTGGVGVPARSFQSLTVPIKTSTPETSHAVSRVASFLQIQCFRPTDKEWKAIAFDMMDLHSYVFCFSFNTSHI